MFAEDMHFERFDKEGDLLYFLRGCTAFNGGPFDLDAFQRGRKGGALRRLQNAVKQKKEIEFGRDKNGNGVCRSHKAEVLVKVHDMVLVEEYRLVEDEDGKKKIPTDLKKVLRTISETGRIKKDGQPETPEENAVRGLWGEGRIKAVETELIRISTPEFLDFSDPRNRHASTVYNGLWRVTMTTRFALSKPKRPKRWAEKLYVKDDDVEIFGNWKLDDSALFLAKAPPMLRAIDTSLPPTDIRELVPSLNKPSS